MKEKKRMPQMNLDELNALFACAYTDEDKALMLEGISNGVNGITVPPDSTVQMLKANKVALKWSKA